MMSIKTLTYLELLRICLKDKPEITEKLINLSDGHIDWIDLLNFAARQGVIGIYWRGIELLFKSPIPLNKPNDDEVMEWWGEVNDIKKRNEELFKKTAFVSNTFKKEGFDNCILKGQGNALMYPDPYLRTPGDIDIWLKGSKKNIISYIHKFYPEEEGARLHIHFPIFKNVSIEVHYTPRVLDNYFSNKQLQNYFREVQDQQMNNQIELPIGKSIPVPTPEFNIILQLTHIYRHFIYESITLKHLVDYYYALKTYFDWIHQNNNGKGPNQILNFLKQIKVLRFSQVIMYIMQDGLGIEKKYLYTSKNERIGSVVLDSIIEEEGNSFLQSQQKLQKKAFTIPIDRYKMKMKRALYLIQFFPEEIMWGFVYRIKKTLSI